MARTVARQAEQALVGQAIDRIDVQAIADLAIADKVRAALA